MSVMFCHHELCFYLPSCTCAANEIEDLTWLYFRKTSILAFMIQPPHQAFENVQGRQAAHTAAVERQQAKASDVKRAGLVAMLDGEILHHRGVWWLYVLDGCGVCLG
jgi:hypothetical protein